MTVRRYQPPYIEGCYGQLSNRFHWLVKGSDIIGVGNERFVSIIRFFWRSCERIWVKLDYKLGLLWSGLIQLHMPVVMHHQWWFIMHDIMLSCHALMQLYHQSLTLLEIWIWYILLGTFIYPKTFSGGSLCNGGIDIEIALCFSLSGLHFSCT